jgi:hypothetical protein
MCSLDTICEENGDAQKFEGLGGGKKRPGFLVVKKKSRCIVSIISSPCTLLAHLLVLSSTSSCRQLSKCSVDIESNQRKQVLKFLSRNLDPSSARAPLQQIDHRTFSTPR